MKYAPTIFYLISAWIVVPLINIIYNRSWESYNQYKVAKSTHSFILNVLIEDKDKLKILISIHYSSSSVSNRWSIYPLPIVTNLIWNPNRNKFNPLQLIVIQNIHLILKIKIAHQIFLYLIWCYNNWFVTNTWAARLTLILSRDVKWTCSSVSLCNARILGAFSLTPRSCSYILIMCCQLNSRPSNWNKIKTGIEIKYLVGIH